MSELSVSNENLAVKEKSEAHDNTAGDTDSELTSSRFDQDLCRKKLVLMIVKDQLPFKHVEGEGFIEFVESLQPEFKIPSRWTICRDIYQLYLDEKLKLQEFFKTSGVCVSLSIHTWTSVQELNYMSITTHYIDKDWKLHKNVISFFVVGDDRGDGLAKLIDIYLREWGIARVFAITVDDASVNDTCVNFFKGRFTSRGADVVQWEHLHMRCTAHILNLIVGEGMKVINDSIKKVRGAVSYVMNSSKKELFRECCVHERIDPASVLCLDVETRWDSTYFMLRAALKFQEAFEEWNRTWDSGFSRDLKDGVPTSTDWDAVRDMVESLTIFYEAALRISASLHVTTHIALHEIDTIGKTLKERVQSPNANIKAIALGMQAEFDKYWGNFQKTNKLLFLAIVVDPRLKFAFISYYFREVYGEDEGSKLANDIKVALENLYQHYQTQHGPKPSGVVIKQKGVAATPPTKKAKYAVSEVYKRFLASSEVQLKNDLEVYLSEKVLTNEKDDFDILKWWDTQQCKFPVLSNLARDILAFPISNVPSEYAFGNSSRVLDPFRSSLSPKIVEALLCGQDWLKNSPREIVVEEDLESIERHEQGIKVKPEDEDFEKYNGDFIEEADYHRMILGY